MVKRRKRYDYKIKSSRTTGSGGSVLLSDVEARKLKNIKNIKIKKW